MKTKNILISFIILIVLYFGANGCNNNPVNSTNTHRQARSEQEFADLSLYAEPGAVIVVDLEHLDSPPDSEFDTDEIGTDAIPIRYTETAEHSFRLDSSALFEIKMLKAVTKEEIFSLNHPHPQIRVTIPAGDYILIFKSRITYCTNCETNSQIIFLQPDRTTVGGSGNSDYDPSQLNQFITTGKCDNCDLREINLSNMTFTDVSLVKAHLWKAKLNSVQFKNANMQQIDAQFVDFENVTFEKSNLSNSQFNSSSLRKITFTDSDVNTANFNSVHFLNIEYSGMSDFSNADFSYADFSYTGYIKPSFDGRYLKLLNAKMTGASLKDATFYNIDISGSDFNYSNLENARFINAIVNNAKFCYFTGNIKLWVIIGRPADC